MKADVQYNDFRGTVAADIADSFKLSDLLNGLGVDTSRYDPIGTKFYPHYKGNLAVEIVCVDKLKTAEGEPYIVEIRLKEPMEYEHYFGLFKRFTAIVVSDYYQQFEISESMAIDEL